MKKFKLLYNGEIIEVYPHIDKYCNNDSLAIMLMMADTYEKFCNLTVNLPSVNIVKQLGFEYQFVNVNNCPFLIDFIIDNKLGELTKYRATSGYCTYPVFKFNLEEFI